MKYVSFVAALISRLALLSAPNLKPKRLRDGLVAMVVVTGLVTPAQAGEAYPIAAFWTVTICDSYTTMKLATLIAKRDQHEAHDLLRSHMAFGLVDDACTPIWTPAKGAKYVFHVIEHGAADLVYGYITDSKGKQVYPAGWTSLGQVRGTW